MNDDRTEFMLNLNASISQTSLEKSSAVDPENLNNYMDDYGEYLKNMILTINQQEIAAPSADIESYSARFTSYIDSNSIDYDFTDLIIQDYQFYSEIAEIIRTIENENSNLTISQLKVIEDIVSETTLLNELEKSALLAFSASRKFVMATIRDHGLYAMGEVIDNDGMAGIMSCFEDEFDQSVMQCMQVLVNYEAPFGMLAAWLTLPTTSAVCIADGIVAGIINC